MVVVLQCIVRLEPLDPKRSPLGSSKHKLLRERRVLVKANLHHLPKTQPRLRERRVKARLLMVPRAVAKLKAPGKKERESMAQAQRLHLEHKTKPSLTQLTRRGSKKTCFELSTAGTPTQSPTRGSTSLNSC